MSTPPTVGAGRFALRLTLAGALSLALLVAGHALLWRWMGGRLEEGFAAWAAARRAAGWRVEHAPPLRGGWPLAATFTLPNFRLSGGDGTLPGGLDWRTEAVILRLRPPRLDRLAIELPGRHRLILAGQEVPFAADRLQVNLPMARDVLPADATLTAERLRLGAAAGAVEVRRAELELHTRTTAIEGEPALALRLEAEEVALPVPVNGLGRLLGPLRADLALSGPVPPGRGPAAKAEAWRDGGGTLELRAFDLQWGDAHATATATLTLDEALQPMGVGLVRLTGGAAAIEGATAAGLLAPGPAATARLLLRLLERPPTDAAAATLEVPLTLQERRLGIAKLPVARLPALAWPAPPPRAEGLDDPSLPPRD